jgi:hypothetical protein
VARKRAGAVDAKASASIARAARRGPGRPSAAVFEAVST